MKEYTLEELEEIREELAIEVAENGSTLELVRKIEAIEVQIKRTKNKE